MKLLYTHENPICVHNAKNIVEGSGINVILKNEFAGGGLGELAPIQTWLELWVANDVDFDSAKSAIEGLEKEVAGTVWTCAQCGEENESSFESCWQCQCDMKRA